MTDAETDAEDEGRLLAALQRGDERAFRQLVETFKDRVYNTCLGFVGRPEEAEDVAQEVFVAVHRSVGDFRGESRLSTWIYRIAVNTCRNKLKSAYFQRERQSMPLEELPGDKSAAAADHEARRAAHEVLTR